MKNAAISSRMVRIVCFAGVLSSAPLTQAAQLTDGSLDVNIDNDGEFNVISLNGSEIDGSSFAQRYTGNTCAGFAGGSAVSVGVNSATYTATCRSFDVTVTSTLQGALASAPTTTGLMRDSLVFTNNTAGPLDLELVSNMDQDLVGSGNDVVEFIASEQAVQATDSVDSSPATLLWAAAADANCPGATFGYDVDVLGSQSASFPMDNNPGPAGPGDTAMSIGYDCGSVAAGESVTFTFTYLFSTDLATIPAGTFSQGASEPTAVPTIPPAGLLVMVLALLGVGGGYASRRARQ